AIGYRLNPTPRTDRQCQREDTFGHLRDDDELVVAVGVADGTGTEDDAGNPGSGEPGEVGDGGHPGLDRGGAGGSFGGPGNGAEQGGGPRSRGRRRRDAADTPFDLGRVLA